MRQSQPVQTAAMWAIGGAVAGAIGTGLARGDWGESFLYAIPVAAFTFLMLWALFDYADRR